MNAKTFSFATDSLRFSVFSMAQGPVVLCLHGFSHGANSFKH